MDFFKPLSWALKWVIVIKVVVEDFCSPLKIGDKTNNEQTNNETKRQWKEPVQPNFPSWRINK